jgi:hypothetical protein
MKTEIYDSTFSESLRDVIILRAHVPPGNVGNVSSHNTINNYGSKLREFEDVNSWSF